VAPPPDDAVPTARNTAQTRGLLPPWRPGQTGNPHGRGRALLTLAARVRHLTRNGEELVAFFFAVFRGELIPMPGRRAQRPTLNQRLRAAEISPSGTGLHIFVRGSLAWAIKGSGIEVYSEGRYMAVTGHRWPGTPPDHLAALDRPTPRAAYSGPRVPPPDDLTGALLAKLAQ
jgi:hypothetical protein